MSNINYENGSGEFNGGWLKLHRKILDNPRLHRHPAYLSLWVHLLLYATHTEMKKEFDGENIILKPGQQITGRKFLAAETGIPESTIDRILKWFESEHQIEQRISSLSRLITILNWGVYQQSGHQNEQRMDIERTTNGQPVNNEWAHTRMKENEEKGEKEEEVLGTSSSSSCSSSLESKEEARRHLEEEQTEEAEQSSEKTFRGNQDEKRPDVNCSQMSEEEYEAYLNLNGDETSYLENAEVISAEDLFTFTQHLRALRKYSPTPPATAPADIDFLGIMLNKMPDYLKENLLIKKMVWWYFKNLYKASSADLRPTSISRKVAEYFYPGQAKDKNKIELRYASEYLRQLLQERERELRTGTHLLLLTAKKLEAEAKQRKYDEEIGLEEYYKNVTEEVQAEIQEQTENTDVA